ncbi:MAG: response regulator [Terriglobia bacterium]
MLAKDVQVNTIVLFGLADDWAENSRKVLSEQGHVVYSYPFLPLPDALALIEQIKADFVFCAAEPQDYKLLLEAIKQNITGLPFIVVSRQPDTSAWLDALQAGASDYWAPPFEAISFQWILEAALTSKHGAV